MSPASYQTAPPRDQTTNLTGHLLSVNRRAKPEGRHAAPLRGVAVSTANNRVRLDLTQHIRVHEPRKNHRRHRADSCEDFAMGTTHSFPVRGVAHEHARAD